MWATSIGSTFSHSPEPGARKSGTPDGTEIPAPVSATTEPASRIRDASSCVPELVVAPMPPRTVGLPALPVGLALGQEGADALLAVLGLEHGGEGGLLGLDAGVDVPVGADLLDLRQRQRRRLGQLARPGQGGVEQLVVDHRAVDQAELVGLLGADRVADEVHLQRLVLADQARQPLGAAEAGD